MKNRKRRLSKVQTLIKEVKKVPYVSKNVRKYMDKRGLKQFELAKLAGVSGATISELINGKKMPTVPILQKVAKALGVTIADLFKES
jgi:transcriptional regulator with XRE-family HTH domain